MLNQSVDLRKRVGMSYVLSKSGPVFVCFCSLLPSPVVYCFLFGFFSEVSRQNYNNTNLLHMAARRLDQHKTIQ